MESLFVLALILYTIVIWSHKIKKHLAFWMISVFGFALFVDAFATVVVCANAKAGWAWNFHTITGFLSLLIMALHFTWALIAYLGAGNVEKYFNRYSVYAWLLWIVAFVSGIPI
jgi:uncharacterized repeat protein (TIGR03987 family)